MSGRLSRYLNQTTEWKRATGEKDGYGKSLRTSDTLKCRIEKRIRTVKDQYGKETVSDTTIYTRDLVLVDDTINGRPVISVSDMVDKAGNVIGYEVCL